MSERLGHASVGITLDVYSHILPGLDASAAKQIGDLLFDQRGQERLSSLLPDTSDTFATLDESPFAPSDYETIVAALIARATPALALTA